MVMSLFVVRLWAVTHFIFLTPLIVDYQNKVDVVYEENGQENIETQLNIGSLYFNKTKKCGLIYIFSYNLTSISSCFFHNI